jgi:hypothetical protein
MSTSRPIRPTLTAKVAARQEAVAATPSLPTDPIEKPALSVAALLAEGCAPSIGYAFLAPPIPHGAAENFELEPKGDRPC